MPNQRISWIRITGIFAQLWDPNVFKVIGSKLRRILVPLEGQYDANDISGEDSWRFNERRADLDDDTNSKGIYDTFDDGVDGERVDEVHYRVPSEEEDDGNKVDGLNMDVQIFEERVVNDEKGNLVGN
ncbi:hypothetical protein L2E82_47712 [Cichorium intybus]|uniref:Uncharacterized protein n=1 Tax=Cichorium intybus TaxID=13427 RepID=A0ACB8YXG7_CICIN|nr:hypothetical protein L2E82_47712 [Cichorium intybus]